MSGRMRKVFRHRVGIWDKNVISIVPDFWDWVSQTEREIDLFVYLQIALPLPATCEVLVGLNDGVYACLRIVMSTLDTKG